MRNECKQNPGRLSSEFKTLPNGADLKAKVKCNQKTIRNTETPKAKFKYTFSRCHGGLTPNQTTVALGAVSTAAPGWSVSGYTCPYVSCPVCPLHTFINDSKCHLPPNVPVPDTPATVRLRVRTHTHAHTRVHAPSPQLRPGRRTPTRRTRHGIGEVGGAGNYRGRRAPRPQSKLLAEARSPSKCRGLGGSHFAGSFPGPSPQRCHPSPGI